MNTIFTEKARLVTLALMFAFSHAGATGKTHSVDIALTFDAFLLPNAHVRVNDIPMLLSVDTGSQFAFHLEPEQIKQVKAQPTDAKRLTIDAAGNTQQNDLYIAHDLSLNGITLPVAKIVPLQQWGLMVTGEGEPPVSPVIGLGAFAGKVLMLDYKNHLMSIGDSTLDAMLSGETFNDYPFVLTPEGLLFTAEHAGQPYKLILDSGAGVSVVWRERLQASPTEDCTIVEPEMDNEGCQAVRMTALSSNGTRDAFTAVAATGDFRHMDGVDGLLGNNFLKNRKVIVDFSNQTVLISGPAV